MEQVLNLIRVERERQDAKWGVQDHSDDKWFLILHEELGEVAKAALENESVEHINMELVQCAAVIVAWVEARERRLNQTIMWRKDLS